MDIYNTMSISNGMTVNAGSSMVSQDKSLDENFYDAVRVRFLQQSAIFLSAECGYLAELQECSDRAA